MLFRYYSVFSSHTNVYMHTRGHPCVLVCYKILIYLTPRKYVRDLQTIMLMKLVTQKV